MTAAEFVSALRARDVTLSVKNGRLQLHPGTAWRTLSPDEAQCVSDFRAAIKQIADEPVPPVPQPQPTDESDESEGEPRVYSVACRRFVTAQDVMDAGLTGTSRATYERAREWLHEQERKESSVRSTNVMLVSLLRHQRGTHGGYRE